MRVLITNNSLAERAGSELYVRDVATALVRRGHRPVAFSTRLGAVAEDLRNATVPVVTDLSKIAEPPDVIHGQHHLETMMALLHFPGIPAAYFCHGWLPWEETPPRFPRILRYVAVDETCRDRLVAESGIPPDRVALILSFVDLARFRPHAPLPPVPRRALVFANDASESTQLPAIREACQRRGITVDVAGIASGRVLDRPEEVLPAYDLVFAKARAAIEAMAVGAAVVACDSHGLWGLVTSASFDELRRLNFGVRALTRGVEVEALVSEIDRYDAEDAARVSQRIRAEADRESAVDSIVRVYEEVVAAASPPEAGAACSELRAASAYLRWLGPDVKTSRLWQDRERLSGSVRELEAELAATRSRCAEHDRLAAAHAAVLASAEQQRGEIMRLTGRLRAEAATREGPSSSRDAVRSEAGGVRQDLAVPAAAHAEALARAQSLHEELERQAAATEALRAASRSQEEELARIRATLTWRLRQRLFAAERVRRLYRRLREWAPAGSE